MSIVSRNRALLHPVEKVSQGRAVKIGQASFMLRASTHQNISDIAAILHNTQPDAIRYVLDETSGILLQRLRQLSRINAEIDGSWPATNDDPFSLFSDLHTLYESARKLGDIANEYEFRILLIAIGRWMLMRGAGATYRPKDWNEVREMIERREAR